ncbi:hypothetical protein KFK09_004567 [Dendrobium nobile]|uniref:Uncharacterized protein n=1 Tax=Dendrobium nobile TaxID=94219 RepID=A0A8T3C5U5_DENNO|nr:hypothetical protein KFK09_004567 [Dendrobium nobile]
MKPMLSKRIEVVIFGSELLIPFLKIDFQLDALLDDICTSNIPLLKNQLLDDYFYPFTFHVFYLCLPSLEGLIILCGCHSDINQNLT